MSPRTRLCRRATVTMIAVAAFAVLTGAAGGRALLTGSDRSYADSESAARVSIGRLQYDGGGDWYANPSSLPNLIDAVRSRTSLEVDPEEVRVRLMDDRVWEVPFLYMTGHGNVSFSEAEVRRLREWILRGGFLHADDNYGLDESFRREIARAFPDRPLVDVPLNHPVYSVVYQFPNGVPKIHEHDGSPPRGMGIFVGDRLAVFYSYESDLGNGWEDLATYNNPPELHEQALRMGVNLVVYAVSSRVGA